MKYKKIARIKDKNLVYALIISENKKTIKIQLLDNWELYNTGEILTVNRKYIENIYLIESEYISPVTGSKYYTGYRTSNNTKFYKDFFIN